MRTTTNPKLTLTHHPKYTQVGFAPANCDYVTPAAGAAAPPAAGAAAVAAGAAAATPPTEEGEEDRDCELAFGEEAGPCDAACPAGEDGVAAGEQPFNMAIKAPATGKGKACPALPLVEKKPCMVTCHAAAAAGAAAEGEGEPCPAEVTWGPCTAACEQKGQAQAKKADGSCGPVAVTRPCAVGAECAAALEGYAVDVLLLLIGVGSGNNKDRTLSRALQVRTKWWRGWMDG